MPASSRRSSVAAARRVVQAGLREPLVQFIGIALLLFSANQVLNGGAPARSGETITISAGRVQQIADSFRLLSGRLPSRAELQTLLNDFVDEEVAYREAIALGLDVDDTIVRRRMRQKLEFLLEDAEAIEEPADAELAAWLAKHAQTYRIPERIAFRQVLTSVDVHGELAKSRAQARVRTLQSGGDPTSLGDASMLPYAMAPTTKQGVATLFGEAFAEAVFSQDIDGWFGPVTSPFGAHAVLVSAREPARDPALEEIRAKLRADWIEARRTVRREVFQARLRDRYDITVEWPEVYASQRANELADAVVAAVQSKPR